jgi:hypothetical protein
MLGLALLAPAGCGEDPDDSYPRPLFDLRGRSSDLFALPYPNDLRIKADGSLDLAGLASWKEDDLIRLYLGELARNRLGGFALNGAAYFRFSVALGHECLPDTPEASLQPGASVYLVNIHKGSPGYGQRVPVQVKFRRDKSCKNNNQEMTYIGDNSLALLPVPGFGLEPATRYAALVTDKICDEAGASLQAATDFALTLQDRDPGEDRLDRARGVYAPLRAFVEDRGLGGIISAAVFTTGRPTELAGKARAVLQGLAAPRGEGLEAARDHGDFFELRGTYRAPNFQSGTSPFQKQGGEVLLDAQGRPRVAFTETMRFALSVPRGAMPAAGWPVVLYAHGTGGSYLTFINNGTAKLLAAVKDARGQEVARMAVVGIDQNLHPPRAPAGTSPELLFFNFQNPKAAVDNVIQAGIDDFSLLRMVQGLSVNGVPWSKQSGKTGKLSWPVPVKFDPHKIYFMGHSQGGLTGPVFLVHEPAIAGAVLSGAGGNAVLSLLEKSAPISIKSVAELALGEKPLDLFHPMLQLIQQLLEPADTANYGPLLIRRPLPGVGPKHIFLSQGFVDNYTPNATTDALAVASGLPLIKPVVRQAESMKLAGLKQLGAPLSANLTSGGASVTGALLQYRAVPVDPQKSCKDNADCGSGDYCESGRCKNDGHFVVFQDARARRQLSNFLGTLARDGVPRIVP